MVCVLCVVLCGWCVSVTVCLWFVFVHVWLVLCALSVCCGVVVCVYGLYVVVGDLWCVCLCCVYWCVCLCDVSVCWLDVFVRLCDCVCVVVVWCVFVYCVVLCGCVLGVVFCVCGLWFVACAMCFVLVYCVCVAFGNRVFFCKRFAQPAGPINAGLLGLGSFRLVTCGVCTWETLSCLFHMHFMTVCSKGKHNIKRAKGTHTHTNEP